MFNFLKDLFGGSDNTQVIEAIKSGAVLVDVRTPAEFSMGTVKGAVNIPLDRFSGQFKKLKSDKTIIVFCASGARSGQAKSILDQNGYKDVINGGGWRSVESAVAQKV